METTLVHFKHHVGFVLTFSVDHKHLVNAVTRCSTLFDQVTQCRDVGHGILAEPNVAVAAIHRGLVVDSHGAVILLFNLTFLLVLVVLLTSLGLQNRSIVD
jgi:hypothetical protein